MKDIFLDMGGFWSSNPNFNRYVRQLRLAHGSVRLLAAQRRPQLNRELQKVSKEWLSIALPIQPRVLISHARSTALVVADLPRPSTQGTEVEISRLVDIFFDPVLKSLSSAIDGH